MKRHKMSKSKSRRSFSRGSKVKKVNYAQSSMRGGWRL